MIKLKLTNISEYKRIVATVSALVPKETSNSNEKCILLSAAGDLLSLTALSSGSHEITLSMPVSVEVEGSVYLTEATLSQMTKSLPQSGDGLEVFVDNYGLNYRLNGLGKIHENIYHNQNAFKGLEANSSKLSAAAKCTIGLGSIFNSLSSTCGTSDYCLLKLTSEEITVYGQFSESGFIKFSYKQSPDLSFEGYFKHKLLKYANSFEGTFSILVNQLSKQLMIDSDKGSLYLVGNSIKVEEFGAVDWIESQTSVGKVVIQLSDLVSAIQWQSYGIGASDFIELSIEEDKLKVRSSKLEEAAEVKTEAVIGSMSIKLPPFGIMNGLRAFSASGLVSLELVPIKIQDREVKILMLSTWEASDFQINAILYEQFNFNK